MGPVTSKRTIVVDRLAGRDGSTAAELSIPLHRAKECLNTDFFQAPLGRKRNGATSISLSGVSFTGVISSLIRTQLTGVSTAAKLLAIDDAATPVVGVLSGGTWSGVTMKDNISTRPWDVFGATLNGLLYYTSDTTQDRLHVFDGSSTRRVGLATPAAIAAPTNTGAGAYAATLRYYKIAYTVQSAGVTLYRSELSSSTSFTPSGAGTGAVLTKSASISEGETHWEIYASTDNSVFYGPITAAIAVGTTTYTDSAVVGTYINFNLAPLVGQNTNWTSVKYLVTDGNRLIGAGSWEGGKIARVWYSPVIGTTGSGFYDHERVPDVFGVQQNWLDLDESDGGTITGIIGPYYGSIYVFKDRQVWKLVPTGDAIVPYRPFQIGKGTGIGALNQQGIVMAEDERGNSAIYFMSHRGVYRLTIAGLQYVGKDVEDYVSTANLEATNVACCAEYHTAKHQIWWYIATGSNNDPDTKLCLDTELLRLEDLPNGGGALYRNGWTRHTGLSCAVRCVELFSTTYATTTSRAQVPYVGRSTGTAVYRTDTGTTDNGTAFQGLITLPVRHYATVANNCAVFPPVLVGNAGSHILTVTYAPNYGREPARVGSVSMSASTVETRVTKQMEDLSIDECQALGVSVGDGTALDSGWTLDALLFSVATGSPVAVF